MRKNQIGASKNGGNTVKFVVGVDPSLTGFAVCKVFEDSTFAMKVFATKPEHYAKTAGGRMERQDDLCAWMMDFIGDTPPAFVCCEAYSHDSKHATHLMGELGRTVRQNIYTIVNDHVFREVAPSTLKKYVTGSGKGKKIGIIAHTTRRWNVLFGTDDEYDAHGLARLAAMCVLWSPPKNVPQRQVYQTLMGREYDRPLSEIVKEREQPLLPIPDGAPF